MSEPKVTRTFAEIFGENLLRFAVHNCRQQAAEPRQAEQLAQRNDQAQLEMLEAAENEAATKRLEEWLSRSVEAIIAQNGGVQ